MYIAQISFFERLIKSVSSNRTNQELDKYKLPILQIKEGSHVRIKDFKIKKKKRNTITNLNDFNRKIKD